MSNRLQVKTQGKGFMGSISPLKRVILFVSLFALIGAFGYWRTFAASSTTNNVTVNFGSPVTALPTYPFGSTISTYGADNITASSTQDTNLKNLNLGLYRIPLEWNNGNPISSAGGSSSTISGASWIQAIEQQVGAQPEIVLGGGSTTNTQFNTINPSDAAGMVTYFNTPGTTHYDPVQYWVIGNEPDNASVSAATYCSMYNSVAQAMQQAAAAIATQYGASTSGATIKIGGPATAYDDTSYIQSFLSCVTPSLLNFVDYHAYAMGSTASTDAQAFTEADSYKTGLQSLQSMISSTLGAQAASGITTQIGEYNWSWQLGDGYTGSDAWDGTGNDVRFFEPVTTAWSAATVGNIAETGSRSFQYSDQNGALGITFDDSESTALQNYGQTINSPMPIYWGIGMFTGANLFRGFGSTVVASTVTGLSNVEAFASTNSDNIVLVNENPTTTEVANVGLTGFSGGTYDAWQTCGAVNSGVSCTGNGQFSAPTKIVSGQSLSNALSVSLPPFSVTTIVLTPTLPPTVSSVASTSISATGATIGWTTNQTSTSQVEYGTTTAYGTSSATSTALATSHSVALTGLTAGTTYHYAVVSTNAASQTTTSTDYTFTTTAAPAPVTSVTGEVTGIGSKCLDDKNSSFTNENTVWLYGCNASNAQEWTVPGDGTIRLDSNKYCLDTTNEATTQGTLVVINACTGGATTQEWTVKSNGSLVNVKSGLCLDDKTSGTANDNPIQIYGCNGTGAQAWKIP
jgi:hypothetical protein